MTAACYNVFNNHMKDKTEKKPRISEEARKAASEFGKMGGDATAQKAGKKGMSERGKMGADARWGKRKKVAKK